jgi:hypothetical protein
VREAQGETRHGLWSACMPFVADGTSATHKASFLSRFVVETARVSTYNPPNFHLPFIPTTR